MNPRIRWFLVAGSLAVAALAAPGFGTLVEQDLGTILASQSPGRPLVALASADGAGGAGGEADGIGAVAWRESDRTRRERGPVSSSR